MLIYIYIYINELLIHEQQHIEANEEDELEVHIKTKPDDFEPIMNDSNSDGNEILVNDRNNVLEILVATEEPNEYCEHTDNRRRKSIKRKSKSLTDVLEKLSSMAQSDKVKVIRKSFEISNIEIGNIMIDRSDLDEVNESKMVIGICNYLRNLNCKIVQIESSSVPLFLRCLPMNH